MSRDYEEFIVNVKRKTGIDLSLYKEAQMKRRLTSLYEKSGYASFREYFRAINNDSQSLNEFLDRMTINVSEFYRNKQRWEVLENKILPRLLRENNSPKIWSSAASTGEEPYTLSMIFAEKFSSSRFSILATDIDENAIQKAGIGIYSERSLSEVPGSIQKKYFQQNGQYYQIKEEIKNPVKYKKLNLLADRFDNNFDLIVCRNVLIYFTEEAKNNLYHKFSAALRPVGILFVGSTEQIFNPSSFRFTIEDTFFYRKG